jgi:hypothetical protein
MSTLSQFAGSKPTRVVQYTSGTGTFTPLAPNSLCRVTLVGGGGSGGAGPGVCQGGGAGGTAQVWIRFTGAQTYAVGAGGAARTANFGSGDTGGNTSLGTLIVYGGGGGSSANGSGAGGAGASNGAVIAATNGNASAGGSGQFGLGGATNAAGAGNGAGGGPGTSGTASGAGSSGLLLIEEFGA